MSPTVEGNRISAPRIQYEPGSGEANSRLNIAVIFTSVEPTLSALRKAGTLASRLHACITLIVPQVVPYPLPLNRAPVPRDFAERHFRVIAGESPVETKVQVYLCRDRMEALRCVLKPHSLIVVGGSRGWWPTPEQRLARQLRRSGHEVVFVDGSRR
jgi:hypothetical protein